MKALRIHLSLILSLLFIMFAFEFLLIISQTVRHYEGLLNENYSIIIASKSKLDENSIKAQISGISSMKSIEIKEFIARLKDNISANNLAALEKSLPKFYTIKLTHFPNQDELESIKTRLLKIKDISKVEVFVKTYDQVYTLLTLVKFAFWFLSLIHI